MVMSADIWTDFPFEQLSLPPSQLAHLVLVKNTKQHPEGDFTYNHGKILPKHNPNNTYTYANIGLYHPQFFATKAKEKCGLGEIMRTFLSENGEISAEVYHGIWQNINTPIDLMNLRQELDLSIP